MSRVIDTKAAPDLYSTLDAVAPSAIATSNPAAAPHLAFARASSATPVSYAAPMVQLVPVQAAANMRRLHLQAYTTSLKYV